MQDNIQLGTSDCEECEGTGCAACGGTGFQCVFPLNAEDYDALMRSLDNPEPANEHLKELMQRKPIWDE